MTRCWMAVLGSRDEPTDAVEDYCRFLGQALSIHDIQLEMARVRWLELGWTKALEEWSEHLAESNATWVLIQYTALAWSRRGFPMEVPRLFRLAKKQGARRAIVFHDAAAYEGRRFVDRIRRATQLFV